jgi:biotin synthase (EC 2.8.1.6)
MPILDTASEKVLERGIGLNQAEVLEVLNLPESDIPGLMELAHQVRLKWCGEEVEVEGIISLKTGGCPRGLSLLLPVRAV